MLRVPAQGLRIAFAGWTRPRSVRRDETLSFNVYYPAYVRGAHSSNSRPLRDNSEKPRRAPNWTASKARAAQDVLGKIRNTLTEGFYDPRESTAPGTKASHRPLLKDGRGDVRNTSPVAVESTSGPGFRHVKNKERPLIRRVEAQGWYEADGAGEGASPTVGPSLMEQLFPEEAKRMNEAQRIRPREVPWLPIEPSTESPSKYESELSKEEELEYAKLSPGAKKARLNMVKEERERGEQIGILVLRNASLNLVEEDFRRLIPRGKHIEGWTLEQGDILKIVPARSMHNLEQRPWYYLLFRSQLGAFTYQGHATRCHRLVQQETPRAIDSPIAPPPGYVVEGMDAHEVLKDFALVPAGQSLELVHLKPPHAPMIDLIARNLGYPKLVRRPDKKPHELRLILDGPQLSKREIERIIVHSALSRRMKWSGGTDKAPRITEWVPITSLADANRDARSTYFAYSQLDEQDKRKAGQPRDHEATRSNEKKVYILGFETEQAAQMFRAYWHRRAMDSRELDGLSDLPPIANVEILW